jgi:hypothetical protein
MTAGKRRVENLAFSALDRDGPMDSRGKGCSSHHTDGKEVQERTMTVSTPITLAQREELRREQLGNDLFELELEKAQELRQLAVLPTWRSTSVEVINGESAGRYVVTFDPGSEDLPSCTCPRFRWRGCCKHSVYLELVWLDTRAGRTWASSVDGQIRVKEWRAVRSRKELAVYFTDGSSMVFGEDGKATPCSRCPGQPQGTCAHYQLGQAILERWLEATPAVLRIRRGREGLDLEELHSVLCPGKAPEEGPENRTDSKEVNDSMARTESTGNSGNQVSPEIVVHATNKAFLNLYDALPIGKVKVEVASYDPHSRAQTARAVAWVGVAEVKLLTHLVKAQQFRQVMGGKYEEYGGSDRDGQVQSRVVRLGWDDQEGRFAKVPYRLTITNGAGKRDGKGRIAPAGKPTSQVSMRFGEATLMGILIQAADYIRDWEAAHHQDIVASRVEDLKARLATDGSGTARSADAKPARDAKTGQGEHPRIKDPDRPMTRAQYGKILSLGRELGLNDREAVEARLGVSLRELCKGEASEIITRLTGRVTEGQGPPSIEELRARIFHLGEEKFGWSEQMTMKKVSQKVGRDFDHLDASQLADTITAMEDGEAWARVVA